jgi:uncharacterized membrane protein
LIKKQKVKNRLGRKGGAASPARPVVESGALAVSRVAWIDAWRGLAIVLMIAYHLCFDLNYFGALRADFNRDPLWLVSRTLIVSMFLTLVGISLVLSAQREPVLRRFANRQLRIGACALLVSAASYAMFPSTFIFFGILHFIFVASIVGMFLLRQGVPPLAYGVAGALTIAAALLWSAPVFDMTPLQWVGFMTHKPVTEDYVPLFPWIGVVLLGTAAAQLLQKHLVPNRGESLTHGIAVPPNPLLRVGAWMGRHSLAIYMLHQPILLGLLYLLVGR